MGRIELVVRQLILPYLFGDVLIAGFLLVRPGHLALIPFDWISTSVGGNSWLDNGVASIAGAFMYFATLIEIPILQGLQGAGRGNGPALSLPNMLVLRKVLGTKKTLVYVMLVCIAATITGKLFGFIVGPSGGYDFCISTGMGVFNLDTEDLL